MLFTLSGRIITVILLQLALIGILHAKTELRSPQIVVSIKPLFLITQALLNGIADAELLINHQDVHSYKLKPSHMNKIKRAQLVIAVGFGLDGQIERAIQKNGFILSDYADNLHLLSMHEQLIWHDLTGHSHGNSSETSHHHNAEKLSDYDLHFWLSIDNAIGFAQALSNKLETIFPNNTPRLQANLIELSRQLQAQKLTSLAAFQHTQKFMVFHDGFQYLTHEMGAQPLAAIVKDSNSQTGIKTLTRLKQLMINERIECVYIEPQFNSKLVETLIDSVSANSSQKIKMATWDALAYQSSTIVEFYQNFVKAYQHCID